MSYGDRDRHGAGPYGNGGGGGGALPHQSQAGRRRGKRDRDDTPPGVSLLVRNLSSEITSSDLQNAFRRIGDIKDVYIPLDYHSKQPKGFAFIEYATHDQARAARDEMNRFLMKGRELEVVFAQEKRKTPGEMKVRTDSPEEMRGSDNGVVGGSGGGGGFERSSSFERHRRGEDVRKRRPGEW